MSDASTMTQATAVTSALSLWKVILHNDDFTPMDFVVAILRQVFNMPQEQAISTMMKVHVEGKAVAGLYTREVAETKVMQVQDAAERFQHPLLATAEQA